MRVHRRLLPGLRRTDRHLVVPAHCRLAFPAAARQAAASRSAPSRTRSAAVLPARARALPLCTAMCFPRVTTLRTGRTKCGGSFTRTFLIVRFRMCEFKPMHEHYREAARHPCAMVGLPGPATALSAPARAISLAMGALHAFNVANHDTGYLICNDRSARAAGSRAGSPLWGRDRIRGHGRQFSSESLGEIEPIPQNAPVDLHYVAREAVREPLSRR